MSHYNLNENNMYNKAQMMQNVSNGIVGSIVKQQHHHQQPNQQHMIGANNNTNYLYSLAGGELQQQQQTNGVELNELNKDVLLPQFGNPASYVEGGSSSSSSVALKSNATTSVPNTKSNGSTTALGPLLNAFSACLTQDYGSYNQIGSSNKEPSATNINYTCNGNGGNNQPIDGGKYSNSLLDTTGTASLTF
jgi:hypothetical protein